MLRTLQCTFLSFITLYTGISNITTQATINPNNTQSEAVKVSSNIPLDSEVDRLSGEVNRQRDKADSWDSWNLRLLALAGLIAVALAVTAVGVSRSNGKLSDLRDELDRAKDRALQVDSKEKDEKIASLNSEAASARLEIAQANERASNADKAAAEAKLNLETLKTPRTLNHVSEMVEALKPYKGMEYGFVGLGDDEESSNLLRRIDGLLQQAEWKRIEMPQAGPSIRLSGSPSISVTAALASGVRISVQSTEPEGSFTNMPISQLPPYVQAAIALNLNLASNVFPSPEDKSPIAVKTGSLKTVLISVGRKPITIVAKTK